MIILNQMGLADADQPTKQTLLRPILLPVILLVLIYMSELVLVPEVSDQYNVSDSRKSSFALISG